MRVTLASDRIALTLAPAFGARITALTDKASGRQWLVPGALDGRAADDARYLGAEARGWDECFPTVAPCDHPFWGRMRDHGLLWGRPWGVDGGADHCTATFQDPRFTFCRTIRLAGACLHADYAVTNHGDTGLPYLWSQHGLLATTPDDRIALAGIGPMAAAGTPFGWPAHPDRDLSRIGAVGEGFALKAYADTPGAACAAVTGPRGGLRFDWHGDEIGSFGLWLNYGGWPEGGAVHQIALEPATAPAGDLAAAERLARARHLAPQATHRWTMRMTMTDPQILPQTGPRIGAAKDPKTQGRLQ